MKQNRFVVPLIAALSIFFMTAVSPFAKASESAGDCGGDLEIDALTSAVKNLFAGGLDDEQNTHAYFGLTEDELQAWMAGRLEAFSTPIFKVTPKGPRGHQTAVQKAEQEATRRSWFTAIEKRIGNRGLKMSGLGRICLRNLLAALQNLSTTNTAAFKVITVDDLLRAISAMEPKADPRARLQVIARELGLPPGKLNSTLVQVFSILPLKAGFVMGADRALVRAIPPTNKSPRISEFSVDHLTGIEPLGDREFSFLSLLGKK